MQVGKVVKAVKPVTAADVKPAGRHGAPALQPRVADPSVARSR